MVNKEDCEKVWQCGHCGVVYKIKSECDECCGGDNTEVSYWDDSNNKLYAESAFEKRND